MTPGGRGRLTAALGAGAVLVVLLAGCTSGDGGTGSSSSASVSDTAPSTTPPPTTSDTPTASSTPTGSPTATGTPTVAPPPSGSPTPTIALCADLAVTATRVPGGGGVTYGLISVTNRGALCSLAGTPAVRLLDAAKSAMTGTATPDGASSGGLALAAGATASTLLEDRSATCQADTRSTYVEVQPTTAAPKTVLALSLPPCSLSVKPFVPGTSPAP